MNKKVIERRIKAIRRQLNKKKKADCLVITKPTNVTYATGFLGGDSWVIVTSRSAYLVTDSRYSEQAHGECSHCRIIERIDPMAKAVTKLVEGLKSVHTVALEKTTSIADLEALRKNIKSRIKPAADIIETLRRRKDSSEIRAIRNAGSIAEQALKRTLKQVKAGISEYELAGALDFQMRKLGATSSFATIVAFGPNASRPHHQPGPRKLKKKDDVLIDFGAKCRGYCCDITRCFVVGRSTSLYQRVLDAVEDAQAAAIKMIKPGVEIARVDAAAREIIKERGLPVYGHGTGHGLGLEIHELPFLKAESRGKLQAGDVVTIEPGVYMPGKLGVRIEDDVLVTETGCKILTRSCPHEPLLSAWQS
jgi:Xaa-Pro aminopeptidase